MVRAFTSYRLRNNPFMHRHLRHVHSPDAFDSMANESKRKQAPQASSGRAWQAEEAAESLPLQNLQFCAKTSEMEGWVEAVEARAGCGQPLREKDTRRGRPAG